MLVCLNGSLVPSADARISVFDHGVLYGDGVFDTVAAVDGRVYWLPEHVARLMEGCRLLSIPAPWTETSLITWTTELFEKNGGGTSRLRLTITRGEGDVPLYGARGCRPNLFIIGTPLDLPDESLYRRGLRLATTRHGRVHACAKSLSFLPSVLGFLEASEKGGDDALFVGAGGEVLEGATFNIAAVVGNELVAPVDGILRGVTRAKVLALARGAGLSVIERPISLEEFSGASEAFAVSTTKRVMPIAQVDGRAIGDGVPGPVTASLLAQFRTQYF
jgi:branched-chain amino acid aminotransferase